MTPLELEDTAADRAPRAAGRFSPQERDGAILSLLDMTSKMARGMAKFARGAEVGDCFNDGCIGAIRAVDTYDAGRGVSLKRYARPIIVGAILNGIRERDPVTDLTRRHLRRSENERLRLAQQLGRLPTTHEMESRDPTLRTTHLVTFRCNTLSLDGQIQFMRLNRTHQSDPPAQLDDLDDPATVVSEKLERAERAARVRAAVAALPQQQRDVLSKIYFGGSTASAVAREWNRTPQRITQIRGQAESKLRQTLAPS